LYPASQQTRGDEKLEIIQLVEHSHLPVCRTLMKLGIPRATFYRWYDLYSTGGPDALGDRSPRPWRGGDTTANMTHLPFRPFRIADEAATKPKHCFTL
jgi:transposase-like protein